MADPNLVDFYSRLARFEKKHSKGYSFDAPGTLSRRRSRKSGSVLGRVFKPLALVALCAIGLKAVIYQQVGAEAYEARVANMQQGQGFDRLGGMLMQADGATVYFADRITAAMNYFEK